MRQGQRDWATRESLPYPAMQYLPLPPMRRSQRPGEFFVPTGHVTTQLLEDATNYDKAWAIFARGRTIPEAFERVHQAGLPQADYIRQAVMGYALTRRILSGHPGISRHAMPAFLTLLATLQRQGSLTPDIWQEILRSNSQLPTDNWDQFNRIACHPAASQASFGVTFSPPPALTEPWEVRTEWTSDKVLGFLMLLQPSLQSLHWLMAYADDHIRSRLAGAPIGGVAIPNTGWLESYITLFLC